jgi:hypothetical protein
MTLLNELYTERAVKINKIQEANDLYNQRSVDVDALHTFLDDDTIASNKPNVYKEIEELNKEIARLEIQADNDAAEYDEEDEDEEITLDDYLELNHMYSFENESGVQQFTKLITEVCGYGKSRFGPDPLHEFLSDNSGAIEVLLNWIQNQKVSDWNDNMIEAVRSHRDYEEE